MLLFDFIYNLTLIVALSTLSGWILQTFYSNKIINEILQGLLFGFISLINISIIFIYKRGIEFDGTTVIIGICTYFFGVISGFITSFITFLFRTLIFSNNLIDLLSIIIAFTIGLILYTKKNKRGKEIETFIDVLTLSLLIQFLVFIVLLIFRNIQVLEALKNFGLILFIVYPSIYLIIGKILFDQKSRIILEDKLMIMKKAVDESEISIVITDKNGIIQYVNNKFVELTGYSKEEAIGKTTRILKSGVYSIDFYKNLWDTILSGDVFNYEFLNKKKNGELYWEKKSIVPLKNERGEITNFVSFGIDVTERKKLIDELRAAKEIAEEANRIKSNFLSAMSHEIRTPLNPIIGFTSLINEYFSKYGNEETESWFKAVQNNAQRLLDTAKKIMEYTQLEEGKYQANFELLNLNQIIINIFNQFKVMAEQKQLRYEIQLPDYIVEMKTDRYAVERVLMNLISNAIKFTPKGFVIVILRDLDEIVKITIKDSGVGISEEYQKHLFETFSQEMVGYKREYEGSGLGLALTKKFVSMIYGEISFFSQKDIGSTFEVILPKNIER